MAKKKEVIDAIRAEIERLEQDLALEANTRLQLHGMNEQLLGALREMEKMADDVSATVTAAHGGRRSGSCEGQHSRDSRGPRGQASEAQVCVHPSAQGRRSRLRTAKPSNGESQLRLDRPPCIATARRPSHWEGRFFLIQPKNFESVQNTLEIKG